MAREGQKVRLADAHAKYLETLGAEAGLPAELRLNALLLEGPPDAIEALRDRLTQLLAERGFAEDYSPTAEGELLEDLIDTLRLKL